MMHEIVKGDSSSRRKQISKGISCAANMIAKERVHVVCIGVGLVGVAVFRELSF